MSLLINVQPAAEKIRGCLAGRRPTCAVILGSGLASLVDQLSSPVTLACADLPHFPAAGVSGHEGRLWLGQFCGCDLLVFQGRYHYYEGYSAYQVSAPVRLAKELGCRKLLLTNAAGGIAEDNTPGSFMLVEDHLNLVGDNPLRGITPAPFIDLGGLYRQDFYPQLRDSLSAEGVDLYRGVLAWMTGPSYETPAEIRMLERMGADAVSMSTVPEAIMAHALGLETVAISLIANHAAGKSAGALTHQDVLSVGKTAAARLPLIFTRLFSFWSPST